MAVKVLFNAFGADDARIEREYKADYISVDPLKPNLLQLTDGSSLVAVLQGDSILAAEIVED
jgi:hypothetical protein